MLQLSLKKTASLLFIAILTVTALFPCPKDAAAEQSRGSQLQSFTALDVTAGDHCPNCPDQGDHSESGHCDSCCSCSCHPPVIGQPVRIRLDQVVIDLVFLELFTALPEVYLPKFIPPQNVA